MGNAADAISGRAIACAGMSVPAALAQILAERDAAPGLAAAVRTLAERYRAGVAADAPGVRSARDREAYVAARMPATAAAVGAALDAALAVAAPAVASHLDLGSGTGAALWAAADRLPGIAQRTAVEGDADFIALAQELAADGLPRTRWIRADLRRLPELVPHDLVSASYALNELDEAARDALVDAAWALTARWLLLVEPGTPRGAGIIAAARARLLAAGAHVVGPCTHAGACPLLRPPAGAPGWCHRRVRVARSRLHRAAKGAAVGWEDEPFAWLAVSRAPAAAAGFRVLAPPRVHPGAVELQLCGADGFAAASVRRRERAAYAAARRLAWGDRWLPPAAG